MNTNSLLAFVRFLNKNKLYTTISIVGLAIGIASCLLISLYIQYENKFDHHHANKERIYRLTSELDFNGKINAALTNLPTAPALLEEYPEVESYARFKRFGRELTFQTEDLSVDVSNVWFTDSTVFNVLTYPLVNGNAQTALTAPNSIVITRETAHKLFGTTDALNQSVTINNRVYQVTGVMENTNPQSDIKVNALVSMSSLPPQFIAAHNQDWFRIGFYTFLLFKHPVIIPEFEQKLVDFEKKYVQPWSQENQMVASLTYHITPITELHFDNTKTYDTPKGNKSYQLVFALLAVFLLLIAIINYINLTLAQSSKRNKEIGIRKTTGATQGQIFKQFISESIILTILASLVALALLSISLPYFNTVLQIVLEIGQIFTLQFGIYFIVLLALIALTANGYPALLQSRLNPIQVFKGNTTKTGKLSSLNYVLLFIQFFFSLFMISGTLLVQNQMNYIANHTLGFEKDKILTIDIPADTNARKQLMPWINTIKNKENVVAISKARMPDGNNSGELMFRIEQNEQMVERTINFIFVDDEFINAMGLDILQGRNFNQEIATDAQQAFIINQQAAEEFGWNTDALNKRVQWGLMPNGGATNDGKVVGVINNFNFKSLHNPMQPLVLCYRPSGSNTLAIRYAHKDIHNEIQALNKEWNEVAPNSHMKYSTLSSTISGNYVAESSMQSVLNYFSSISIILALVGLFSLMSKNLENRTKEMGIRKVLGASITDLFWLIGKRFWILNTLAIAICIPVTWWCINEWLRNFAYHTTISAIPFILSYGILLLFAFIAIAYHVIKINRINPANTLRYE